MRGRFVTIAALLLAGAIPSTAQELSFSEVERGRYLTHAGDCEACHTDIENEGIPFAGGRGLSTPFGVIYTPNLTPDNETGLGRWTRDEFYRAMNEGVGRNGEHLYPAFPYPFFTKMPREDVDAIFAYLRTLEPVNSEKPENELPFPLNIRQAVWGWKLLFFDNESYAADATQSEAWNRGRYLVEGPGHCGACHTGKNMLGADVEDEHLRGGLLENWFAPNIRGGTNGGIAHWEEEDIVAFLGKGRARHTAPMQRMGEVVALSTQHLATQDLRAIATYLKSLDDPEPEPIDEPEPDRLNRGEALYFDNCAACHDADRSGVAHFFAQLDVSNKLAADDPSTAIRVVLEGARAQPTNASPTPLSMPPFHWKLSDDHVADLLTYLRANASPPAPPVAAADVAAMRDYLKQH